MLSGNFVNRFDMDGHTDALLRSLKRNGTEYSDIMIKGPDTLALGRLVLDPFSAAVYSSSPRTFAAIEAGVRDGLTIEEAIERLLEPATEANGQEASGGVPLAAE